jgi:predicted nucleic acid-binding protein
MTVLDTNFLVDLLRGKPGTKDIVDSFNDPKTTIINVFELYYGAKRSTKPEEGVLEVSSIAKLMDSGKPIDINHFNRIQGMRCRSW